MSVLKVLICYNCEDQKVVSLKVQAEKFVCELRFESLLFLKVQAEKFVCELRFKSLLFL